MKRLKIVRRIGMPETNSSSSHSVSISMSPENMIKPGDSDWDITIEDGVLKIPGDRNFGWEYFKTNSLLTKLQYLCGIYCSDIETPYGKKRIYRLKKILKNIFNVRDVEFLWLTKYKKDVEEKGVDNSYYGFPEIDHNSSDIFEEITENYNVIQHFLFSRDSWLYGGNDNSDTPRDFYNKVVNNKVPLDQPEAIFSADFGGKVGRIDWESWIFPQAISRDQLDISKDDEFSLLECIYYNITSKEFEFNFTITLSDLTKNTGISNYLFYYGEVYCPEPHLLYISSNIFLSLRDKKSDLSILDFCKKFCSDDYKLVKIGLTLTKYNWTYA